MSAAPRGRDRGGTREPRAPGGTVHPAEGSRDSRSVNAAATVTPCGRASPSSSPCSRRSRSSGAFLYRGRGTHVAATTTTRDEAEAEPEPRRHRAGPAPRRVSSSPTAATIGSSSSTRAGTCSGASRTRADRAPRRHLVFDDDTFVEPGGKALVTNEEDHQRHPLDRHQDARASRGCSARRASRRRRRTSSTGPTTRTCCRTGRSRSRTPTTAASSSSATHRIVRQIGATDVCAHDPPRTLGARERRHAAARTAACSSREINGSWIDDFTKTGKLRWSFQAPVVVPVRPAAALRRTDPARRLREPRRAS